MGMRRDRATSLRRFPKEQCRGREGEADRKKRSAENIAERTGKNFASFQAPDCLVGLVDKASASRAEDPGFESRLRRDFSRSSHTSDSQLGTPLATLPGAWRSRVSAGTGRPGVSIL